MSKSARLVVWAALMGLLLVANASAGTATLNFTDVTHPGTSTSLSDNSNPNAVSEYIGPYTGNVNGTQAISLYCDDLNDNIGFPSTSTVNVTYLIGGDTRDSLSTTRFATGNSAASITVADHGNATVAMPTGTTLYEELVWLFTQLGTAAAAGNTTLEKTIQEAAWTMTTPAGHTGDLINDNANAAADWIWLATQDYALTNVTSVTVGSGAGQYVQTIVTPNYNSWFILDSSAAALNYGETAGQQELLAYNGNQVPTLTPEPPTSTFGFLGCGLLVAGILARRRRTNANDRGVVAPRPLDFND